MSPRRAIMVMFDSLNRHMLEPYGCGWVKTPNFQRLAAKSVTFDNSYVGSMPCMPARRELHTGRYNFLHRSWGPLEPFDDSMPELLKNSGILSHLVSDHYHYWEEGGANYHTKFTNWQISRGQEGDPWLADMNDPDFPSPNPKRDRGLWEKQDWVNRAYMQDEQDMPQAKTFAMGMEFLKCNHSHDNWFLQIETFDPHEPYFSADKYKELYDFDFSQSTCDWPNYINAQENPEQHALAKHFHYMNAALVSMCDEYMGKILDTMDRYNLWEDTMLIVNTDHGFLLGEHDWWGKCRMPFYNEIAHTPLFIWDPRVEKRNERRQSLVQNIDIAPTLLDFFDVDIPADMQGKPLTETVAQDKAVREFGLFGVHGGHVNITDGRYVYMRAPAKPENAPLFNYTHMPARMRTPFSIPEMRSMQWHQGFDFTKGAPVMKINVDKFQAGEAHEFGTMLFDTTVDPQQQIPLDNPAKEAKMVEMMIKLMHENDAPEEQFARLGFTSKELSI